MENEVRLAIRQEGQQINAYLSTMKSLEGSLLIGSISVGACKMRPALFEQFKALMTAVMTAIIEVGHGGTVLGVHEQPVPEHEKAGHA